MQSLTIILTVMGRKKFTKRWLDWMLLEKCKFKIIIADGDEDKNYTENLLKDKKYNALNIDYIKYPYDKDVYTYIQKIASVSKKVLTKYVIHADNDDFIFIKNLETAISYYEKNQHLSTLALPHYRFSINKKNEDKLYIKNNSKISFQKLKPLKNRKLFSNEPLVRLEESVKIFASDFIYYGIHKSKDYARLNNDLLEIVVDDLIFHEWYISYFFPLLGSVEAPLNLDPFVIRQENTSTSAYLHTYPKMYEYIIRPNWSKQLKSMKKCLLKVCLENNLNCDQEIEERFDHAFLNMIGMVNFSSKIGSYLNRYKFIYNFISSLYLKKRGKGRTSLSMTYIKKNENLNTLTNFLNSK